MDTAPVVMKRRTMFITPLAQSICLALMPSSDGSVMLMTARAMVSALNQNTFDKKIDFVCTLVLLFAILLLGAKNCANDNAK